MVGAVGQDANGMQLGDQRDGVNGMRSGALRPRQYGMRLSGRWGGAV